MSIWDQKNVNIEKIKEETYKNFKPFENFLKLIENLLRTPSMWHVNKVFDPDEEYVLHKKFVSIINSSLKAFIPDDLEISWDDVKQNYHQLSSIEQSEFILFWISFIKKLMPEKPARFASFLDSWDWVVFYDKINNFIKYNNMKIIYKNNGDSVNKPYILDNNMNNLYECLPKDLEINSLELIHQFQKYEKNEDLENMRSIIEQTQRPYLKTIEKYFKDNTTWMKDCQDFKYQLFISKINALIRHHEKDGKKNKDIKEWFKKLDPKQRIVEYKKIFLILLSLIALVE